MSLKTTARTWLLVGTFASISVAASGGVTAEEDWSLVGQGEIAGEDYSLYERNVVGSATKEYRAECVFNASTQEIFDAALRLVVSPAKAPAGQFRQVVRTGDTDFVVHTRIDLPLATDRDVNIHIERWRDANSGALGLVWRSTSDEGPDPEDGVVRMPKTQGSWRFMPEGARRTRVVYQNYTDIGGYIPVWVIDPMLRDESVNQLNVLQRMLDSPRQNGGLEPARDVVGSRALASQER